MWRGGCIRRPRRCEYFNAVVRPLFMARFAYTTGTRPSRSYHRSARPTDTALPTRAAAPYPPGTETDERRKRVNYSLAQTPSRLSVYKSFCPSYNGNNNKNNIIIGPKIVSPAAPTPDACPPPPPTANGRGDGPSLPRRRKSREFPLRRRFKY